MVIKKIDKKILRTMNSKKRRGFIFVKDEIKNN